MRGKNQHLILLAVLTVFTLVGITQPALAKTKINICALQDISTQVALKLLKESDFEARTGISVQANLLEFAPMVQAHKMVAGKMDYTPFPGKKRADGTVTPPMPMIGAHSLAINKDSRNKKEAFMVLQFLTSKAIGKEYILRGGKPFRQSHFFPEAFEKFPSLKAYASNIPTGKCRPNIPEYPAVSEIFTTAFHRALAQKDADVEKIMKEAAQKANNEVLKPSYPAAYK